MSDDPILIWVAHQTKSGNKATLIPNGLYGFFIKMGEGIKKFSKMLLVLWKTMIFAVIKLRQTYRKLKKTTRYGYNEEII